MRAIVHIGMPKTGSTSIQAFLWMNRAALRRQGVLYERCDPRFGSQLDHAVAAMAMTGRELNHNNKLRYGYPDIASQKRTRATVEAHLERHAMRTGFRAYLISSEHILPWLVTAEDAAALDTLLSRYFDPVHYIIYLRRQEEMVASSYSEVIKRGYAVKLEAQLEKDMQRFRYFDSVSLWAGVVGADRLDVRLLESDWLRNGDLLADYCAACGLDPGPLAVPPRQNSSLTDEQAELLRIVNAVRPELRPDGSRDPLAAALRDRIGRLPTQGPPVALPPRARQWVRRHHEEGNEKLRAAWFPDRPELFPERPEPPETRPIALVREDALRLAAQLLADPMLEAQTRRRLIVAALPAPMRRALVQLRDRIAAGESGRRAS